MTTEEVCLFLSNAGFERMGSVTTVGAVARIAGNRFAAAKWSTRPRYQNGSVRVTVGPRTTAVYRWRPTLAFMATEPTKRLTAEILGRAIEMAQAT